MTSIIRAQGGRAGRRRHVRTRSAAAVACGRPRRRGGGRRRAPSNVGCTRAGSQELSWPERYGGAVSPPATSTSRPGGRPVRAANGHLSIGVACAADARAQGPRAEDRYLRDAAGRGEEIGRRSSRAAAGARPRPPADQGTERRDVWALNRPEGLERRGALIAGRPGAGSQRHEEAPPRRVTSHRRLDGPA